MSNNYPHDALVRAWLDGKAVQFFDSAKSLWIDMDRAHRADKMPHFYREGTDYRIKPETVRYRVALMDNRSTLTADNLQEERTLFAQPSFVRWLTDWIEAPV